jgi:hypothetical protein
MRDSLMKGFNWSDLSANLNIPKFMVVCIGRVYGGIGCKPNVTDKICVRAHFLLPQANILDNESSCGYNGGLM